MKKIISLSLCTLVLIIGCTKPPTYDLPRDANGNAVLYKLSVTTSPGISTLDDELSATATFATAKSGDVMNVELLQLQLPAGQTTKQLLPMAGTQKTVTVGGDLKSSVTYTRAEAKLNVASDYVQVIFNGETDYGNTRVTLVPATVVSKPKAGGKEVDVARTDEVAYFNVTVSPKTFTYDGTLAVTRKNGKNDTPVAVPGSPFPNAATFLVPISGTDFADGKDTMIYSFKAVAGSYSDDIPYTVIVRQPFFYLKKSATLKPGGAEAGRNLLINAAVKEDSTLAMITVSGSSLVLQGGSNYLAAGNVIEFVPSTSAMFELNNVNAAKNAFLAGTPETSVDPSIGTGIYIYRMVNGPNAADVFYGMLKITGTIPGVSITFEYRIGDQYAHLAIIK